MRTRSIQRRFKNGSGGSPVPEAPRGWGPIPVTERTVTEWTESKNWTESTETYEAKRSASTKWTASVEADEAKRSPLLRRGAGSPRRKGRLEAILMASSLFASACALRRRN